MKQNQTRKSLNIASETKPDKKPLVYKIFHERALSIRGFSSDGYCGMVVSLPAGALSRHVSNSNQLDSEKI